MHSLVPGAYNKKLFNVGVPQNAWFHARTLTRDANKWKIFLENIIFMIFHLTVDAEFRNTRLERLESLAKDYANPEPSTPRLNYVCYLEEPSYKDFQAFICHLLQHILCAW